ERQAIVAREHQIQNDSRQVQELRLQVQNREKLLESQVREFTAKVQVFQPRISEQDRREQLLAATEAELARLTETLAKDKLWHDTRVGEQQKQLETLDADVRVREAKLAAEQQAVQQLQSQYQNDLIRLDRHNTALEQREQAVASKSAEVDRR